MTFDRLFDPNAMLLVLGGTIAATLLRSGPVDIAHAARALRGLFRRRFSGDRERGALATQVQHIKRDGLLRAPLAKIADKDLSDAVGAMLQRQSVDALIEHHDERRARRERVAGDATRLFYLAADLAPVFGLAGTLIALTQLPVGGLAPKAISGVVSAAVLTTLYGVLSANLLFAPLGRQIARVCEQEERERQEAIDWLKAQIGSQATAAPTPTRFVPGSRSTRMQAA